MKLTLVNKSHIITNRALQGAQNEGDGPSVLRGSTGEPTKLMKTGIVCGQRTQCDLIKHGGQKQKCFP